MATNTLASSRMRREYGEKPGNRCYQCCNCQRIDDDEIRKPRACIAYSPTMVWDPSTRACGLFNISFLGMKPKRRCLEEMYKPKGSKTPGEDQQRLF